METILVLLLSSIIGIVLLLAIWELTKLRQSDKELQERLTTPETNHITEVKHFLDTLEMVVEEVVDDTPKLHELTGKWITELIGQITGTSPSSTGILVTIYLQNGKFLKVNISPYLVKRLDRYSRDSQLLALSKWLHTPVVGVKYNLP